ncbi:MAG: hypothetical protein ACRCZP_01740 [Phycicoccus sp.]
MRAGVVEAVGWCLLVVFAGLVWWPAAVGAAGVVLVMWANTREPGRDTGRAARSFGAAFAAGRDAWRAAQADELARRRPAAS